MPWYEMIECPACYRVVTLDLDAAPLPEAFRCGRCGHVGSGQRLTYFEETTRMDAAEWERLTAYWRDRAAEKRSLPNPDTP